MGSKTKDISNGVMQTLFGFLDPDVGAALFTIVLVAILIGIAFFVWRLIGSRSNVTVASMGSGGTVLKSRVSLRKTQSITQLTPPKRVSGVSTADGDVQKSSKSSRTSLIKSPPPDRGEDVAKGLAATSKSKKLSLETDLSDLSPPVQLKRNTGNVFDFINSRDRLSNSDDPSDSGIGSESSSRRNSGSDSALLVTDSEIELSDGQRSSTSKTGSSGTESADSDSDSSGSGDSSEDKGSGSMSDGETLSKRHKHKGRRISAKELQEMPDKKYKKPKKRRSSSDIDVSGAGVLFDDSRASAKSSPGDKKRHVRSKSQGDRRRSPFNLLKERKSKMVHRGDLGDEGEGEATQEVEAYKHIRWSRPVIASIRHFNTEESISIPTDLKVKDSSKLKPILRKK
jgi:hypothetical protein